MLKTAITNAAYEGRTRVTKGDLLLAAQLALPHRLRRRPFEEGNMDLDRVAQRIDAYGQI